jgi:hypothetical protein
LLLSSLLCLRHNSLFPWMLSSIEDRLHSVIWFRPKQEQYDITAALYSLSPTAWCGWIHGNQPQASSLAYLLYSEQQQGKTACWLCGLSAYRFQPPWHTGMTATTGTRSLRGMISHQDTPQTTRKVKSQPDSPLKDKTSLQCWDWPGALTTDWPQINMTPKSEEGMQYDFCPKWLIWVQLRS